METIKRYGKNTIEYAKLNFAASAFSYLAKVMDLKIQLFEVTDVYFDYGQDWWWTTIHTIDGGFQVLNPREHEAILLTNIENIYDVCRDILLESIKEYPDLYRKNVA